MSTKFCIGTEPGFCTRRRYLRAPPVRVPAEVETEPPSQVPWIVLLETSWAMGATVALPVARQIVSAVSPSPSRSSASACEAPEQRRPRPGASLSSVKSFDSGPATAPLRMVVAMLIHTCWLTPRLPLPAFQRQRSRVRPVPAKFGICSKVCGAGSPVPWSSKLQLAKTRSTGSRSVAIRPSHGHRIARLRGAAHPQPPAHRLAGVERSAAGEVVLGRVELHERAAQREGVAGVAADVGRPRGVDGGERGAVLDRAAERHRAAGVVRIDDLAGDLRPGGGAHADRRLAVLPADLGDVLAGAQARRRRRQRGVGGGVRRAPPEGEDAGRGVLLVAHPHADARREVAQVVVGAGGDAGDLELDRDGVDHHQVVERHVAAVARHQVVAEGLVEGRRVGAAAGDVLREAGAGARHEGGDRYG